MQSESGESDLHDRRLPPSANVDKPETAESGVSRSKTLHNRTNEEDSDQMAALAVNQELKSLMYSSEYS